MDNETYERRTKSGDMNGFILHIIDETGLEYQDVMILLPDIVNHLRSERQQEVFKMHYFMQDNIISIAFRTGLQYGRVEEYLNKANGNVLKQFMKIKEAKENA